MNLKIVVTLVILFLISAGIPLTNSSQIILDNDIVVCGSLDDITRVSIQPSTVMVSEGEIFMVSVFVEPTEPIIGVALKLLYFDPNIIHANSIYEGDLFGFYHFCDLGIIDNVNGVISDVYVISLAGDAPSEPGTFVTIEFTAQQGIGTSDLDIEEVIVASIVGESLPLEVNNGEVRITDLDTTPPYIDSHPLFSPLTPSDPLDTIIGWENFSVDVTDASGVDEVKLIVTNPDVSIVEYPMAKLAGTDTYYINITLTEEGCYYTYHIWADDIYDNYAESPSLQFELPANEDIDLDGQIQFMDLVAVVIMYGDEGPLGWCREDVDNDGQAQFMDLVAIVVRYGEWWGQC